MAPRTSWMMRLFRPLRPAGLLLFVAALPGGILPPAAAQQRGPITPEPGREVKRIEGPGKVDTPAIPVPDIVRRFLANEDEISRAHQRYGFQRSIQVQEFSIDGSESGKIEVRDEIFLSNDGKRYRRVTERSSTHLNNSPLSHGELRELAQIPFFPLTSEQAPRYTITYLGSQPLDELKTYVFRVQPKHLERRLRQFEGLVYVDDHDLAIVMTFGRFVSEVEDDAGAGLPFNTYEIVRENVDGKYWFPTYVRSEDTVKAEKTDTRLRLTIRMTGFKSGPAVVPAPSGQTPPPPAKPFTQPRL
jgi:hypothetical protein